MSLAVIRTAVWVRQGDCISCSVRGSSYGKAEPSCPPLTAKCPSALCPQLWELGPLTSLPFPAPLELHCFLRPMRKLLEPWEIWPFRSMQTFLFICTTYLLFFFFLFRKGSLSFIEKWKCNGHWWWIFFCPQEHFEGQAWQNPFSN